MPEIDASIIGRLEQPKFDPLGTVGKLQGIQQGLLNNRLLGMNIDQTQAQREAARLSVGPDGLQDVDKYTGLLAEKGASPEALAGAQQQRLAQIQAATAKLQQQREELGLSKDEGKVIGASLLPGIRDGLQIDPKTKQPVGLTKEQAAGLVEQGLTASGGHVRPELIARARAFLNDLTDDPVENLRKVSGLSVMVDPTPERVAAIYGANTIQDAGDRLVALQTPGLTGAPTVTGAIQKDLSPSQLAGTITYTDEATGKQMTTTLGALLGRPVGGAPSKTEGGGEKTGRYPSGNKLEAPGGLATSLAPGEKEARTASATQSATAYQRDVQEAGGYAQRIQGLNKAYAALEKATTGPGTGRLQNFGAVLNSFGIKAPTNVDSYAEANKYLQDYANRRGADLGLGTDAARALVNAANPGVQTPKGAAESVLKVLQGLERMQASQVAAAQAEGIPPDKYADWRAKWNRSVDPSAFVPEKLTKEGWEAKRKSMGERWPAYKRGLDAALAAGVLTASDLRK